MSKPSHSKLPPTRWAASVGLKMPQRTPNSFRLSSVIVTIRASITICSMGLSNSAINFLINLVVVFVFALINHVPIGFNTLVIIPLFIEVLLMAMGVAFILSDSLLNTVILVLSGKLCFKLVCMLAQLSIPSLTFFKETRRLLQRL